MIETLKKLLGYAWAAPLTLPGLLYVTLFSAFGWYKWDSVRGDALVWRVQSVNMPSWLHRFLWKKWKGQTYGQVIVMSIDPDVDYGKTTLRHEQEHVCQCMRLGIFQPLVYGVAFLGLWVTRNGHPYLDNPLEIDARRAAGQYIDIVGVFQKANARAVSAKR